MKKKRHLQILIHFNFFLICSIIFSSVQFLVILLLLSFDVYALVGNTVGNNPYITTLATIGLYIFVDFVISTIQSYVNTMVIEEKYGCIC